jgi:hypothetical protein
VSNTLGKGYFTLGKGFDECNTRQRTLDKYFIGKGFFAEYFFGHSAKTLPSVEKHSANYSFYIRDRLQNLNFKFVKFTRIFQ